MDTYKIGIIGVGLIGGSLAAAVKRFVPGVGIWGCDFEETLKKAKELKYIDTAVSRVKDLPADLDILFLGAPLKTNIELLKEAAALHKWKDLLITDLGSTKGSITHAADELPANGWSFVGGHPMAGGEKTGVEWANPFLFQNAVYVLTPSKTKTPSDEQMSRLINLLYKIGARIIKITAEFHDRLVAHVSHLPYAVAVSLVNFLKDEEKSDIFYQLAAGGYRDLTRIAQSSYGVWGHIIEDNKPNIIEAVDHLIEYFNRFKEMLGEEDPKNLKKEMQGAQRTRVKMPAGTKGFINPLVDIRVEIEDKPGVLSDITTIMADEGLNIKDIAILKIRENLGGVLQISFEDGKTARKASQLLQAKGYRTTSHKE
jgi:prephenate dehydrogenase